MRIYFLLYLSLFLNSCIDTKSFGQQGVATFTVEVYNKDYNQPIFKSESKFWYLDSSIIEEVRDLNIFKSDASSSITEPVNRYDFVYIPSKIFQSYDTISATSAKKGTVRPLEKKKGGINFSQFTRTLTDTFTSLPISDTLWNNKPIKRFREIDGSSVFTFYLSAEKVHLPFSMYSPAEKAHGGTVLGFDQLETDNNQLVSYRLKIISEQLPENVLNIFGIWKSQINQAE